MASQNAYFCYKKQLCGSVPPGVYTFYKIRARISQHFIFSPD